MPPAAPEAEAALLGALLLQPDDLPSVGLPPQAFYLEKHRHIYAAMQALLDDGREIDTLTLSTRLEQQGKLESVGGTAYLTELLTCTPSATHLRTYAADVRDACERRTLAEVAGELARIAYDAHGKSPQDRYDLIEKQFARLHDSRAKEDDQPPATWSDLAAILAPIEWAWNGWLPIGHMAICASEPGKGKSALALRIASSFLTGANLPDGQPFTGEPGLVLWVECESAQSLNLSRAKSWGLPEARIITPFPDGLLDAQLDFPKHQRIVSCRAHDDDVKLIVVDSLSGSQRGDEKAIQYAEVAKWLAQLARDSRKPILLVHHLRKKGFLDGEEISLDRLRGTGGIAQYARVVWAIDDPDKTHPEKRRLYVIKSNFGRFPARVGFEISEGGITFGAAPEPPRQESTTDRAADLLLSLLMDGPKTADRIKQELEGAGISWWAANRAKDKLGILSVKPGGIWHWSLPAKE